MALLTALTVGGALLTAAGNYVLGRTAESVVLTARQRLISQLLRLRVGALDRLKPGDLLARVTSDTTLLRTVTTYGLVHAVNGIFLILASVYLEAMRAVEDLNTDVLITVGRDADPGMLGEPPPHVRVERWVDQATVLGHTAAVICHGGGGSVLGALAAGAPLVVVPLCGSWLS